MIRRNIEICVISDTHLGTYACHAAELFNYLNSIQPDTLIINGDFLDITNHKNIPALHDRIMQEIIKMSNTGSKVYYLPGNREDKVQLLPPLKKSKIQVRNKLELQLDGKKYLILHGHNLPNYCAQSKFQRFSHRIYDVLLALNKSLDNLRRLIGRGKSRFFYHAKDRVEGAVKVIERFEQKVIQNAATQQFDYVICGHIHRPKIKMVNIDHHQLTYMNSGDWVENLSSLEYLNGKWRIYQYDSAEFELLNPRLHVSKKSAKKSTGYQKDKPALSQD